MVIQSVNKQDQKQKEISKKIFNSIEPKIFPQIELLSYESKSYFKVPFEGSNSPYSAKGVYYIRTADESRNMTQQELFKMIRKKIFTDNWEQELTNYTIDDIDEKSLKDFYASAINCGRLNMDEYNKEQLLIILNLLVDGKLNNAGYYLFGKNPNINLKLSIFATDEKLTFIDMQLEQGNIFQLFNKAINYIHSNIHWRVEIGKVKREEIPKIPVKAIREIVINSFAHAKYISETEHEINIYPGKVVIYNPGSFPDDLSPLDFVNKTHNSIKRNPIILDVLFRGKDVEKAGSGFKRVYELCKEDNIECFYKTDQYGFTYGFIRKNNVNYKNEEKNCLSDNEIIKNKKITKKELASILCKNEKTIQRYLASLTAKGYITRIGNNQYGYWNVLK